MPAKGQFLTFAERAARLAKRNPSNGCLEWQGVVDAGGYGCTTFHNVRMAAHRAAWIEVKGSIPEGLQVLHRCDNPRCIDPSHLFLGTNADNHQDKIRKGRQARNAGTKNGHAKLTPEQIAAIRSDPRKQGVIAAEYGIHQASVSDIKRGKSWRHLKGRDARRAVSWTRPDRAARATALTSPTASSGS